nr:hypothetical protein [uncultured Cohaesibacter sp.]
MVGKKLRGVTQMIAERHFSDNYGAALDDLSHKVASIELVPYHSKSSPELYNLASADAARQFVKSRSKDQTIIVMRSVKAWDLPDQANIVKYQPGEARGVSLPTDSQGGKAILKVYDTVLNGRQAV